MTNSSCGFSHTNSNSYTFTVSQQLWRCVHTQLHSENYSWGMFVRLVGQCKEASVICDQRAALQLFVENSASERDINNSPLTFFFFFKCFGTWISKNTNRSVQKKKHDEMRSTIDCYSWMEDRKTKTFVWHPGSGVMKEMGLRVRDQTGRFPCYSESQRTLIHCCLLWWTGKLCFSDSWSLEYVHYVV